jgi:calcium-translocating P-type ATPase
VAHSKTAWHAIPATRALALLESGPAGLSEDEASARLDRYGPNRLPKARAIGPARVLARQFTSPLIYLLVIAGGLSLVIGDKLDAIFIFGVLGLNALIGAFQELKADASARALRSLVPRTARVRRGGLVRDVSSDEVVPGDIVELESGMAVIADMRLIEATALQIDESTFTGESTPVRKQAEARLADETPVADRVTMVHAGTSVLEGRAIALVVQTGAQSELGHIDATLEQAARSASAIPLIRRIAKLARQIAIAAVLLIAILGGLLAVQGEGWREIALLAIALAVAAIPEGLPIAVTVALSTAASRMAQRNVIVRALPAVEGLGACTLIASDKTGTLTANRLTVQRVVSAEGSDASRADWLDRDAPIDLQRIGEAAALCNEAKLNELGSPVGDAVDLALLDFAKETGRAIDPLMAADRLSIVPYEPALRYAAVEALWDSTSRIVVKGAPETVVPMCGGDGEAYLHMADDLAREGYRVIALAERRAGASGCNIRDHLRDLEFLGFAGLTDPLRHGVVEAIDNCKAAGIGVAMITGDHPATAFAIARQLGMAPSEDSVVTGAELVRLGSDRDDFTERVHAARVFARIEPAQKLAIVRAFQDAGEIVAVTGDGVNDGPALRIADIGVSMGRGGTDVARGASDLVLADDNFATIVAGIEEGRVTFANIRKIVLFMLATGAAEILMFLAALSVGLPMPLTPVQLLWLNLVTNGVLDVTLGFGRGDGDELHRPPEPKLASLLDREALVLMLPGAALMTAIAVWVLGDTLSRGLSIEEARNHVLVMVVVFQVAFLLAVRNLRLPFWRWHPPENIWMFVGMALAVALQVAAMTVPFFQQFLGTGPVDPSFLWLCGAAALAILLITEFAKASIARSGKRLFVANTEISVSRTQ